MKGNWHQSLSVVSSSFISWPIVMKEMQFDQPPYQTSFQYFMLENHKIQPKNQLKNWRAKRDLILLLYYLNFGAKNL